MQVRLRFRLHKQYHLHGHSNTLSRTPKGCSAPCTGISSLRLRRALLLSMILEALFEMYKDKA